MKLFYHKGILRNFGDDLNAWLWPRILQDVVNDCDDGLFVGIGTLLNREVPPHPNTVIFGSGCGYGKLPKPIPSSWHIYCVRGPLSAKALGIDPKFAVADGALLLRTLNFPQLELQHTVSFIPHWESATFGKWREVCREAGVNYVDPRQQVETVVNAIRTSRKVVTGSMHGAIIADAFRVPWIPVRPFARKHFMKWFDWGGSVDVKIEFESLPVSNFDEVIHDRSPRLRNLIRRMMLSKPTADEVTYRLSPIAKKTNLGYVSRAVHALSNIARHAGQLSKDEVLNRATSRLVECLERLRKDYSILKVAPFHS